MQTVATPFYLDWTFWAVVVAFLAIFLSQIPPILTLLKRAKLDLELYSKISIAHKLGNPNLQLHLILNNVGGRKVRVKDINVSISRDGEYITNLPSQSYLQNQSDQNNVLFTSFSLGPNQEWAHITNFLNFFDRNDEKLYQEIEGNMLSDFRKNKPVTEETSKSTYEHPKELVDPAIDFYTKHFCWIPGEYSMNINVVTDNKSANIAKYYRFTVFESQTKTLEAIKEHIKYGGGLWWNPNIQTSVILAVVEA
jgi:hypothetical protein